MKLAYLLVLAGCGRIDFALVSFERCDWRGPIRLDPAALESNLAGGGFIRGTWLSADSTTIVFTQDDGGTAGYVPKIAQRPDLLTPFVSATLDTDFDIPPITRVAYTDDALDAVIASSLAGSKDLYESSRATDDDLWPTPILIASLSTPIDDEFPWLSPDGLTLWFDRASTVNDQDLYMTTRERRSDAWPAAELVTQLDDPSFADFHPSLDAAQLTILFASGRSGLGERVYYATRDGIDQPWTQPQLIALRPEALNQADPSLSRDACDVVFGSPPGEIDGDWKIWSASWQE